jgi:hypothetical protein
MRSRSLLISLFAASITFTASALSQQKQPPEKKPPVATYLHQPLKEARLEALRVHLKKPMEIVEQGVKRTVSVVLEFRVISSQAIPARALDPVLVVGDISVREYRYENRDRSLVFTLYDPEKAKDGAEVYLQFGTDASTRTQFQSFRAEAVKDN